MLESRVGYQQAVATYDSIQPGVKLVGTAPVVAVHQRNLNGVFASDGNLPLPLEADNVFLEAHTPFNPHPLFLSVDGCPACLSHTADNLGGGQERVTATHSLHGLAGVNARGRKA